MDYKNFTFRILVSFIFLIIYLLFSLINFEFIFFLILAIYFLILIEIIIFFKKKQIQILIYLFLSFISILNIEFEKRYF